jgi:hypothetical protein
MRRSCGFPQEGRMTNTEFAVLPEFGGGCNLQDSTEQSPAEAGWKFHWLSPG